MEFNLKTDKEELESIMTSFRMMMDKGFNNEHTKADMINQMIQAMMPLLTKQQSTMFIPPNVAMDASLPSDEQLKMMTNDEAAFQKAVDARETLKRMIHPLYHI